MNSESPQPVGGHAAVSPPGAILEDILRRDAFDLLILGFTVVMAIIGVVTLIYAARQVKPLRKTLEELANEQKKARRLKATLIPPTEEVTIRGFDPRFDNTDWRRILAPHLTTPTVRMDLSGRYREFYEWYRSRSPNDDPEVLVVDLLYVPELLKKELIAPLNQVLPIADALRKRRELYGTTYNPEMDELSTYLCSDVLGRVGALPLWLNTHGRFVPDAPAFVDALRPAVIEPRFDRFVDGEFGHLLEQAGIQSTFLAFEFWAHLAYHGGVMFTASQLDRRGRAQPSTAGGRLTCRLVTLLNEYDAFCRALADLATRLQFSSITREKFINAQKISDFKREYAFQFGHLGEARLIRNRIAFWKPAFSSELLRRAMPRRDQEVAAQLSDESCFKPPFINQRDNNEHTYLSALGGYGIALPRHAASSSHAREALEFIFLANPCIWHPYLPDMVEDSQMSVEQFAVRHARPRVPFWRQVEAELDELLFGMMLSLDRKACREMKPKAFWMHAYTQFKDGRSLDMARGFAAKVADIANEATWDFDYAESYTTPAER